MEENLEKRAKNEAIKFVALRERSSYEVRKKLKVKEYSEDVINKVIKFLLDNKYVDDARFAELYSRSLIDSKGKGKNYLRKKLRERGINSRIIETELAKYSKDMEFEIALKEAGRRRKKTPESLLLFLRQRGFSQDVAYKAIKAIRINASEI